METLVLAAIMAVCSIAWFYLNTEKTSRKTTVLGGLDRPLDEIECDYMETLPLMGATVSASQNISPAHESLLLLGLVDEEWSNDGESRHITFTSEGLAIARSMRQSGNC